MGRGLISFLIAISAGTWIYNKFMRYTGNLTQRAVTAAVASGLVILLIAYILLGFVFTD